MAKRSDDDYELDPNVDYFKRGLVFCAVMLISVPIVMYILGKLIEG